MGFLPTAYALVVAGLELAVAALCWGWPRGELWPLETRWAAPAMGIAAFTTIAAAMLMAGILPDLALRAFIAGAGVSFIAGTSAVIPSDAPSASRKRRWVVILALPAMAAVVATTQSVPAPSIGAGEPHLVLTFHSAVAFAIVCGSLQVAEALAIAMHWPRTQARSSLVSGLLVFLAGFVDVAALLGQPLPLIGAVTAGAIASSYIASRMLAQFRVALEGAEGRVPGYALRRFLGAGGMAEVFFAEAVGLLGQKRVAAVKRVRRDLVDDPELCAMFLDEARIAAELRHPNIVEVYSFGTGGQGSSVRPYIAMELVEGLSLSVLLRHSAAMREPLPLPVVAQIGVALSSALHYAHTLRSPEGEPRRIVHRDVSPHNVLISRTGGVKLIDFGIARASTRETHTQAGHMRGKIAYAAPEQISASPVDARTDVFALGVLLYEATTLRRPFSGENEPAVVSAILEGRRKRLIELRPDAVPIAASIERAMELDPQARWRSAEELGRALEHDLGEPLSGAAALAEWVRRVEAQRAGPGEPQSTPIIEVAASKTLTTPPPESSATLRSGETLTVADPAVASRRSR